MFWIKLAVLAASVGGVYLLWTLLQTKRWKTAWRQFETNPQLGERAFQAIISRLKKRKALRKSLRLRYVRAYLGRGLCLIKLGRYDDADTAIFGLISAIRQAGGLEILSADDEVLLCRTYLDASPDPLPRGAVAAFAHFFLLPTEDRTADTQHSIIETVTATLELAPEAGKDQIETAIRIGHSFLKIANDEDWVAFLLGLAYQRAGKWNSSVEVLKQAVAAEPGQVERQRALGHSYWKSGDGKKARGSFLLVHSLSGNATSAYNLALICIETKDEPFTQDEGKDLVGKSPLEHARSLLIETTNKQPGSVEAWVARGETESALGNYDAATSSLERALAIDPKSVEAHIALSENWLAQGEKTKARQSLDKARAIDPDHRRVTRLSGDIAHADGDFAESLAHYQKLPARYFSADADLAARFAQCHLEEGEPAEAVRLLAGRDAYDFQTRLTLGRSLARIDRWPDALQTLEIGDIKARPPTYRYYFAAALGANGRYEESENLLLELSADKDWRRSARRQLGHIRLLRGDYDGAQSFYSSEAGSAASPADWGRLALLREDYEAAEQYYQQAISESQSADLPGARFGLAVAKARLGQTELIEEYVNDEELSASSNEVLGTLAYENGQHAAALEYYNRAIVDRQHVPSWILSVLATGQLQMGHYREALPHLVELQRRQPNTESIRFNLALCRYQFGRQHFKSARWDMARGEWERASKLLDSLGAQQAGPIRKWAMEAAYRAAIQIVKSDRRGEHERAQQMFETGCRNAPDEPRWWFGAGLANALTDDFERSAAAFDKAIKLLPDQAGFHLGKGLSLQAAGQGAGARAAFQETLKLTANGQAQEPTHALFSVASRFALAMSHAADREWENAGSALEPLFEDPLIQSSSRIENKDIAQAMVAYYGVGGLKSRASEIARKYLKTSKGVGDILIGLVQAESGDYAGAAETLGEAYVHHQQPEILAVLIACLLAAAAEKILARDLAGAESFTDKALRYHSSHQQARRLKAALSFGRQMQDLDLNQIEKAIQQCKKMIESSSQHSAQIVRTLGVLYHRQAIETERKNTATNKIWTDCIGYWKQRILQNAEFWRKFEEEYNAGKTRRERVKTADMQKWQEEIRVELFATTHVSYAALCIKKRDKSGAGQHLEFIWEWAPQFEPADDFLVAELQDMDNSMANLLTGLLSNTKNKKARDAISHRVAAFWNTQANEIFQKALAIMSGGQVKIILERDNLLSYLRQTRNYLEKAHRLWPENDDIKEAYHAIRDACRNAGI